MADADVQITAGSGTKIDTRTVGAGSDEHRQVVVIGDPFDASKVAALSVDGYLLVASEDPLLVDVQGNITVNGDKAHDVVDGFSAPVKIGGRASSTQPTWVASDDRVNAWFQLDGALSVQIVDSEGGWKPAGNNGTNDSDDPTWEALYTLSRGQVFNGTNWDRLRGNTAGLFAQGNVAHDAADSGNPIKIGGKAQSFNTALASVSAFGDRVDAAFSEFGALGTTLIEPSSGSPMGGKSVNADGATAHSGDRIALDVRPLNLVYNGTNWDRLRGDTNGLFAQGNVAHNTAESGNPVKIGGKSYSNVPTPVAAGNRVEAWFGTRGNQYVTVVGDSGTIALSDLSLVDDTAAATALASAAIGLAFNDVTESWDLIRTSTADAVGVGVPVSGTHVFNGTNWDRLRGNTAGLFAQGNVAHDGVDAGNPVKIGGKAYTGTPATVANGDRVDAWFDAYGSLAVVLTGTGGNRMNIAASSDAANANGVWTNSLGSVYNGTSWDRTRSIGGLPAADANTGIAAVAQVPHKIGYTIASATAQYTTTQTSTTLGPTVTASQRMVVTSIQIQAGGTTAGAVQVYFGTGAYSRGTTPAVFDGEFAPSATSKPGYAQSPSVPYMGAADAELKVTTSAAINPLTVTVWYYLVAV